MLHGGYDIVIRVLVYQLVWQQESTFAEFLIQTHHLVFLARWIQEVVESFLLVRIINFHVPSVDFADECELRLPAALH